jgi:hypothetical protein
MPMGQQQRRTRVTGRRVLRRRSVRLRLTAGYGLMFVVSGAVLLAIASGLVVSGSTVEVPAANQPGMTPLKLAQLRITELQHQLATQNAQRPDLAHLLLSGSLIALGIMTAASLLVGWVVAGRVLRPLQDITATTQRISADSLHERLAMPGPGDELKDLADTIDGLLERLEGAFAAQRRFVANASHELRTPLTTMRASLDVAVAKPEPVPPQTVALADRVRAELNRVDQLLEGFLVLARAQHGALPGHARLSLSGVVSGALGARAAAITARDLTLEFSDGCDLAWVEGSEPLLSRMVDNVIDNAIGHNQDGGWIRVTTGADGPLARMVVETGGAILDQRQVAQLAQPFRRLGADRTGSDRGAGLGLSIVAAIAAAHGGSLDLDARAEGGLRVSIGLPRVARPLPAGVPA